MRHILASLMLTSCIVELRDKKESTYSSSYATSEPMFYQWTCDDDYYHYEAWVDIEAVDCDAFKIVATVETYDYYVYQEDLMYDGGCDWYSYVYLSAADCYDIYDVTAKAYY